MATAKKPVLHYFDLGSLGRGEVVRLFLKELRIDFEDVRFPYDDSWPAKSKSLAESGLSVTGKVPVLEIDGHQLSQHIPILRYLARSVGSYDGVSNYDKYLVDAVADTYVDWRAAWVANLTHKSTEYKTTTVPEFYSIWTRLLALNSGPYILGDTVTYADFAIFQALDNDEGVGAGPDSLSEPLKKLRDAISQRPNIKEYVAARKA